MSEKEVPLAPNEIGLARYEDVGDVEQLNTENKTIVTAINELKELTEETKPSSGDMVLVATGTSADTLNIKNAINSLQPHQTLILDATTTNFVINSTTYSQEIDTNIYSFFIITKPITIKMIGNYQIKVNFTGTNGRRHTLFSGGSLTLININIDMYISFSTSGTQRAYMFMLKNSIFKNCTYKIDGRDNNFMPAVFIFEGSDNIVNKCNIIVGSLATSSGYCVNGSNFSIIDTTIYAYGKSNTSSATSAVTGNNTKIINCSLILESGGWARAIAGNQNFILNSNISTKTSYSEATVVAGNENKVFFSKLSADGSASYGIVTGHNNLVSGCELYACGNVNVKILNGEWIRCDNSVIMMTGKFTGDNTNGLVAGIGTSITNSKILAQNTRFVVYSFGKISDCEFVSSNSICLEFKSTADGIFQNCVLDGSISEDSTTSILKTNNQTKNTIIGKFSLMKAGTLTTMELPLTNIVPAFMTPLKAGFYIQQVDIPTTKRVITSVDGNVITVAEPWTTAPVTGKYWIVTLK